VGRCLDDLSYQDVAPSQSLDDYYTLRQLAERLERNGGLRREQAARLITVHSFSKTDCFAGARLAVTEIRDSALRRTFQDVVGSIRPNLAAILIAYLFYRRHADEVGRFWRQRNLILMERMQALEAAARDLPEERNPYHIRVEAPKGSMYPRLVVDELPSGVSLDWLASGLAPRGIGLLPFSTFARTARGFDLARKSFRLTLGGKDGPFQLQRKARRVIIDLNRLIEDQETLYCVKALPAAHLPPRSGGILAHVRRDWPAFQKQIVDRANAHVKILLDAYRERLDVAAELRQFTDDYLPFRLQILQQRLIDRAQLADAMIEGGKSNGGLRLMEQLERETRSVSLEEKQANFRSRLYDRTVHPTQMYALDVDLHTDHLTRLMVKQHPVDLRILQALADGLAAEYVGGNVSISSDQEADEMVVDLHSLADAQNLASIGHDLELPALLSFWGDWDGSTRPSGQGHRLAAGALLANVTELSRLWKCIHRAAPGMRLDPSLAEGIRRLEGNSREFWALLNEITELTSQLEKRYLRVLPFDVKAGFWRRMGMRMHLARDPISRLWQHNDRLERRMYKLRQQRSASLEQYLQLNQRLQESLHEHLDAIQPLLRDPDVALRVGRYRNALKRFVLTPRIHQRMILSRDQFAIDTTVHNIVEINRMAGRYGVPGLVLAIQVSMSSDPEALIALDRKLQQQRREVLRNAGEIPLPGIWVVPLFENIATIHSLESYMDRVWEYALQSRRLGQESADRFREIVCEVFFAGSDLSQQIGQPAGEAVYREAKYQLVQWLSRHDLTEDVRIKLGSGEPAQRQSGYYDARGTRPPVLQSASAKRRLHSHLGDSSRRAWEWAHSPLRGIQAGGEFRTFQSNLAERMRFLPTEERMGLLFHVWQSQAKYEDELHRAASALKDTRLHFEQHSLRELETLTIGQRDAAYQEFLDLAQQNFRQILYGREEDVVGIHVISHFASRAVPPLRDRPVVRPSQSVGDGEGQAIVGKLARTLPLARHGSMLRAIGHNHAQTMMLGVNQLTTGLFRALNEFSLSRQSGSERLRALEDIVLPRLNVYDMLHTLRVYHDPRLEHVRELELMFPAGNSAFVALREDNDLTPHFIPMLQRELMRRSGMDVSDAFADGQLKPALLPAIQPDLAVLLQPDLFNRDWNVLQGQIGDAGDPDWAAAMQALLQVPDQVRAWRSQVWNIIKTPIRTQVESFVGLALAIHSLRMGGERSSAPLVAEPAEVERLRSQVAELLRDAADDPLRQFLVAAVQYLTELPGTQTEAPVDVLRALRDVERIVKIEEQALGPQQQALVRFYMLKIARLCGENG